MIQTVKTNRCNFFASGLYR